MGVALSNYLAMVQTIFRIKYNCPVCANTIQLHAHYKLVTHASLNISTRARVVLTVEAGYGPTHARAHIHHKCIHIKILLHMHTPYTHTPRKLTHNLHMHTHQTPERAPTTLHYTHTSLDKAHTHHSPPLTHTNHLSMLTPHTHTPLTLRPHAHYTTHIHQPTQTHAHGQST